MQPILYAAVGLTVFLVVALTLALLLIRPSAAETRLLGMVETIRKDARRVGWGERCEERLLGLAARLKKFTGIADDALVKARLASAGMGKKRSADVYFAARLLSPLAGLLAASFAPANTLAWMLAAGGVGYLAPDLWLRSRIKRRRERIRKGFPDAVDLLVIAMEAGLGLDQALLRVGEELSFAHPEIHQELMRLNLEQRAGKPRMEAWQSMAERTRIPEMAAFVNMLAQTDRFGTPILAALSRLANDIRLRRRQHAEEMAAKAKVKILFPLVLFIFPCLFIVLLGPAVLNIAKTLGSLSK